MKLKWPKESTIDFICFALWAGAAASFTRQGGPMGAMGVILGMLYATRHLHRGIKELLKEYTEQFVKDVDGDIVLATSVGPAKLKRKEE